MKVDFKKYRIVAFTLLIVLGINVVMPPAALASGFYCDVKSGSQEDAIIIPAVDCCAVFEEANPESGLIGNQNSIDYCAFLQECNQSISDSFTELDSLLPIEKKLKILVVAFPLFNTFQFPDNGWNTASPVSPDGSFPYPALPVYLVNSTFLN